jgi:hypothetical protein
MATLYPFNSSRSTLADAKARLNIHALWRHFGFTGLPAASCRCPWREDHKPSFSVNADGTLWNALTNFTGKRVRIFGHDDDAGRGAVERWAGQLASVGADVDAFSFAGLQQVGGKPVKDLNDALLMDVGSFIRVERILPL